MNLASYLIAAGVPGHLHPEALASLEGVRQAKEDALNAAGEDAPAMLAVDLTGGWPM